MNRVALYDKSIENLKAAKICIEKGFYNASVNRAYYACAQIATVAILTHDSLPASPNHKSTRSQLQQLLPPEKSIADRLLQLFSYRNDADYTDKQISRISAIKHKELASEIHHQITQQFTLK